ncbi:hypothetical protein MTO96_009735 [Rhipicephalus appendiculatus]
MQQQANAEAEKPGAFGEALFTFVSSLAEKPAKRLWLRSLVNCEGPCTKWVHRINNSTAEGGDLQPPHKSARCHCWSYEDHGSGPIDLRSSPGAPVPAGMRWVSGLGAGCSLRPHHRVQRLALKPPFWLLLGFTRNQRPLLAISALRPGDTRSGCDSAAARVASESQPRSQSERAPGASLARRAPPKQQPPEGGQIERGASARSGAPGHHHGPPASRRALHPAQSLAAS